MKNFENITVLLQGPVSRKLTKTSIANVKKILPGAKIILSTWKGENFEQVDGVEILYNKDPGASILDKKTGQLNNINRQIVSTLHGLKKVSTPLVLKIRSDIVLESNEFLNFFEKFKERNKNYSIFKERLLICEKYCRPSGMFPYHISDWFIFGYTEDLIKLFDVPLENSEDDNWFYRNNLTLSHKIGYFPHFRHRYCAEQYIWHKCISKYFPINFNHMFDFSNENIKSSNLFLVDNFVVLPQQVLGFRLDKFNSNNNGCLLTGDWLLLYNSSYKTNKSLSFNSKQYLTAQIETVQQDIKNQLIDVRNNLKNLIKNILKISIKLKRYFLLKSIPRASKVEIRDDGNDYTLLGRHLYNFKRKNNFIARHFCFFPTKKESSFFSYTRETLQKYDIDRPIIVIEFATGETAALARNLEKVFINHHNAIFFFARRSSYEIFNLLTKSQYDTELIPKFLLESSEYKSLNAHYITYTHSNAYFYLYPSVFWDSFFCGSKNYVTYCKERLDLDFSRLNKFEPDPNDLKWAREFISSNKIKEYNFILFLPEASSIQEFSSEFWNTQLSKIELSKYPIVENRVLKVDSSLDSTIKLNCDFGKLFALASFAHKIVMLRSGMSELLSMTGVELYIYYPLVNTAVPFIPDLYSLYTMKQFNCPSSVKEFIVDIKTEEILSSS